MLDRYLKYAFFSFLLLSAAFLAFEAGEKGGDSLPKSASQKLFKSFPDLKEDFQKQMQVQTQNENTLPEASQKDEKNKKEEEVKKDKQSTNGFTHEVFVSEGNAKMSQSPVNRLDTFGTTFIASEKSVDRKRDRKILLPQISNAYIPVYHTPQGVMVINSQVSVNEYGRQYEIHLYDETGKNFQGTFVSEPSFEFPFQGLPKFHAVNEEQFTQSSRYFVFRDISSQSTQKLLHSEPFVSSLIQSSSRDTLDQKAFLGKDSNSNLKMYQLYPGVYVGEINLN